MINFYKNLSARSAVFVGFLLSLPFIVLNTIANNHIEPFYSFFEVDTSGGFWDHPVGHISLIIALLALLKGAFIAAYPILRDKKLYIINALASVALVTLFAMLCIGFWSEIKSTPKTQLATADKAGLYYNETFDVTYKLPKGWFGPEIYGYEGGFRFEIGTSKVYPYGTDLMERDYPSENDYSIVSTFYTKPETTNYAMEQYKKFKDLKDGEKMTDERSITTKTRSISKNGYIGVEYLTTLSDTAQTETVYAREAVIISPNGNTIAVLGTPDNVTTSYEAIDIKNLSTFRDFVDSAEF